jgi:hypothetical protein
MSEVQAVLFRKDFFTPKSAHEWLEKHKMTLLKPFHETSNFYRGRINEPSKYSRFVTQKHGPVEFVLGFKS